MITRDEINEFEPKEIVTLTWEDPINGIKTLTLQYLGDVATVRQLPLLKNVFHSDSRTGASNLNNLVFNTGDEVFTVEPNRIIQMLKRTL